VAASDVELLDGMGEAFGVLGLIFVFVVVEGGVHVEFGVAGEIDHIPI
jgi:hypothetical protein